jgi:hypothetical protein
VSSLTEVHKGVQEDTLVPEVPLPFAMKIIKINLWNQGSRKINYTQYK